MTDEAEKRSGNVTDKLDAGKERGGEFADRQLAEHLVLCLRAEGVEHVHGAYRKIHRAFGATIACEPQAIEALIGFPEPHPLFGSYRCVDDALQELSAAGAIELYHSHMLFLVSPEAAKKFADRYREGKPLLVGIEKAFMSAEVWR